MKGYTTATPTELDGQEDLCQTLNECGRHTDSDRVQFEQLRD